MAEINFIISQFSVHPTPFEGIKVDKDVGDEEQNEGESEPEIAIERFSKRLSDNEDKGSHPILVGCENIQTLLRFR